MLGLGSVLVILIALSVVVFLHELGHMVAAKRSGIVVYEFAVGMGPRLLGFKKGDTLYTLRLLPIGGFVRLAGMDGDPNCRPEDNFYNKPLKSRALTIIAGPLMNLLLGFIIYTAIFMILGVPKVIPVIEEVSEQSPAIRAGLMAGDRVVSVQNVPLKEIMDQLIMKVKDSKEGDVFTLGIQRDGTRLIIPVPVEKLEESDPFPRLGVTFKSQRESLSLIKAVSYGGKQTITIVGHIFEGLGTLVTGGASLDDLSGPVGLFQVASFELDRGFIFFLNIIALISINLGLINLFPFPVLDGGHLVLMLIEWIRGKALSKQLELRVNQFGMILLLSLMIFLVFNDIVNWNDRVEFFDELNTTK